MKRRTLLPAILATSLLAAACGGSEDDSAPTDTSAIIDETQATDPEPAEVDDTETTAPEPEAPTPATEPAATEPVATEPTPPPTEPSATDAPATTEAAPDPAAPPSFEPLAVIDVGSTGGGNLPATDLAPVLLDSQLVGIPLPNMGSLVGNRVTFSVNEFPGADGGVQHGSNFDFTTQVTTDMSLADISDAYAAAVETAGEFDFTQNESTTDTRSQVGFQATGSGLPQYIVTVSGDTEFPGVVQINVRRITTGAPGEIPLPIGAAAAELAEPMRVDAENDIDVTQWSYDLSYSQFAISGTSRFVSSFYRFDLGEGTSDEVPGLVDRTVDLFGAPAETDEIGDDFFQLTYGGFEDPMIDVKLVPSSNEYLEITWRLQREVEVGA